MNFLRRLQLPGQGANHAQARAIYLRALGAVYLAALLSWWVQVDQIAGSGGLLPLADYLERAGDALDAQGRGRLLSLPTVFWLDSSDAAIHLAMLAGTLLAALLLAGLAPGPCLLGLWAIYLSLLSTGGVFMSFQWDILLLEAGFLAILLAPWRRWRLPAGQAAPPLGAGEAAALWLTWFLVAKLMFQSGWVKLAWATAARPEWWPEGTALTYHYLTQPIPNPLAWWMHQLPAWFHRASLWPMYAVELLLPACVFLGSRARLLAAAGFAGLMLGILATGNFTYFNWLTLVLCLPLVADRWWRALAALVARILPRRFRPPGQTGSSPPPDPVEPPVPSRAALASGLAVRGPALALVAALNLHVCLADWHQASLAVEDPALPWTHLRRDLAPAWTGRLRERLYPLHLASGYGLFRSMTTERPEIIFEGSADGAEWREYVARWKPGPLDRRPPQVAPHQPRVAWQLWFAALEPGYHPQSRNAAWISALVRGLGRADPAALSFFEGNPFPDQPPRYLRASLYRYEFSTPAERRETGHWWKRERLGLWLPPVPAG